MALSGPLRDFRSHGQRLSDHPRGTPRTHSGPSATVQTGPCAPPGSAGPCSATWAQSRGGSPFLDVLLPGRPESSPASALSHLPAFLDPPLGSRGTVPTANPRRVRNVEETGDRSGIRSCVVPPSHHTLCLHLSPFPSLCLSSVIPCRSKTRIPVRLVRNLTREIYRSIIN